MKIRIIFQLVLAGFIFASTSAWGQKNYLLEYHNNNSVNASEDFKQLLEIDKSNTIKNIENKTDDLRINHQRYKQYVKGYPVEGVSFVKHKYPDGEEFVNGLWIKDFTPEIDFDIIPESQAIEAIEKHFGDTRKVAWNHFDNHKPKIDLVWYDKNYRKEAKYYRLFYKVKVVVDSPYEHYNVFVDARTGLVFHKYKSLNCANHPAEGVGLYTGDTVSFVVDSIAVGNYKMRQYNRNGSTNIVAKDASDYYNVFFSSNNVWEDSVAVDCYWGTEKTIDYYYQYHGRNGLDDNGGEITVNVHVPDPFTGGSMANAFWNGEDSSINIGDGDIYSPLKYPLSSLEIIAHELTHGVTEFSAGLKYEGESGAINESISDMFGITVEQLNYDEYNWELGDLFGYIIRRMNDPKSLGMPACYKGIFWEDGADVHTNSSIGNLWYYYLVEGGEGINEKGDSFKLEGLGFEKAAKIVYRTLTVYLTESSDYPEFEAVSVRAVKDLFGVCSPEYQNVRMAWQAVGVGEHFSDNDLKVVKSRELESGCGLDLEEISASFTYRSCNGDIPAGTIIKLGYLINSDSIVTEEYKVEEDIKRGDTINYVFTQKADLSQVGSYTIKTWLNYDLDKYHKNDMIEIEIENRFEQNEDFKVVEFSKDQAVDFCGNEIESFGIKLQFLGCDGLEAGTKIPIEATLDNSVLETSVTLTEDISYFDTINLHVTGSLYTDGFGEYPLYVIVNFPQDTFIDNNSKSIMLNFVPSQKEDLEFKFEDATEKNDFIIYTGENIPEESIEDKKDGDSQDKVILFEGGEVLDSLFIWYAVDIPEKEEDIWTLNPGYESQMCKCINATDREDLFMSFDYNIGQSYSWGQDNPPTYDAPDLFSAMRIMVNDSVITDNYVRNDNFENEEIDLSDFVGEEFTLCFQMKTLMGRDAFYSFGYLADFVKLDNIKFYSKVGTEEELYKDNNITLQPNPVNDLLTVNLRDQHTGNISFEVFDVSGKKVFYQEEMIENGENSLQLDLGFLNPGFYVLKTKNKKTGLFLANKFIKE